MSSIPKGSRFLPNVTLLILSLFLAANGNLPMQAPSMSLKMCPSPRIEPDLYVSGIHPQRGASISSVVITKTYWILSSHLRSRVTVAYARLLSCK